MKRARIWRGSNQGRRPNGPQIIYVTDMNRYLVPEVFHGVHWLLWTRTKLCWKIALEIQPIWWQMVRHYHLFPAHRHQYAFHPAAHAPELVLLCDATWILTRQWRYSVTSGGCLKHDDVIKWKHFYPRPVLAFGYCHRLCLCICQCVCVSQSLACPHDNSSAVQARITKFET